MDLKQLIEDANSNYETGRFISAAKSFEFVANKFNIDNYYTDMLYFYYRALHSYKKANDKLSEIIILKRIAQQSIEYAMELSNQILKTDDYKNNIFNREQILFETQQLINYTENKENIKQLEELYNLYIEILQSDVEFNTKMYYVNRFIQLAETFKERTKIERAKIISANTALAYFEQNIESLINAPHNHLIIQDTLMRIASWFYEFNHTKEMHQCYKLLIQLELEPELFVNYKIPKITTQEELATYFQTKNK